MKDVSPSTKNEKVVNQLLLAVLTSKKDTKMEGRRRRLVAVYMKRSYLSMYLYDTYAYIFCDVVLCVFVRVCGCRLAPFLRAHENVLGGTWKEHSLSCFFFATYTYIYLLPNVYHNDYFFATKGDTYVHEWDVEIEPSERGAWGIVGEAEQTGVPQLSPRPPGRKSGGLQVPVHTHYLIDNK